MPADDPETTDAEVVDAEPAPPAWEAYRVTPPLWAIVEIMGHKVRAGSISDTQIGGATMLRIQHPTVADHMGAGPLTEYYASSALFSIRPCTRAAAAGWAHQRWNEPPAIAQLEAARDTYIYDGDEDEDVDW